ncbi:MAG: hypothetical protein KC619_33795 [Myxococcales bacterium]|nr:hypothetical protein [Myxococcales bacterium]
MRWWEDGKVARTLGRFSWIVLVGGFVMGTRFAPPDPSLRWIPAVVVAVVVAVMSFPTALGLWHTRADSTSRAWRMIGISLAARILATVWVTWLLLL